MQFQRYCAVVLSCGFDLGQDVFDFYVHLFTELADNVLNPFVSEFFAVNCIYFTVF